MLTSERLKQVLSYDPLTGIFVWRVTNSNAATAGEIAGSVACRGYRLIGIDGKRYVAQRLAWLYMTGEWPTKRLDHINNIRDDNAWLNLRPASPSQNSANSKLRSDNKSGLKGVRYVGLGRWRADIRKDGKTISLGTFFNPNEAHSAYCDAARKHHGEFARAA